MRRLKGFVAAAEFHFGQEVVAEAGLLALVSDGGVGDVQLSLETDDAPMTHGRSLPWTRAFTWSHELPASRACSSASVSSRDPARRRRQARRVWPPPRRGLRG